MNRKITITRQKRFIGWVIVYYVVIDNEIYAKISNGKTIELNVDSNEHKLLLFGDFSGAHGEKMRIESNVLLIPNDDRNRKFNIDTKAFSIGDFECVHKVGHVYGFVRCYHDEKYLIVANLGTREERARVDVARYGMRKLKCQTSDDNSLLESSDGIHFIDIPRLWIKVYKVEK